MNLGNNIKFYRTQKKMTQEELAELLGTTSKSVSRWEQSITYPDISLLPFIANIFEITVDELLGVEKINQNEFVKELNEKALEYQKNYDLDGELKLWQDAYKKLPNNEEIKYNLISIMVTINIVNNRLIYINDVVKLSESILEKSTDNLMRLKVTECLVSLYSQMDEIEMAEYYAKQLPSSLFLNSNVVKTRYLKGDKLLNLIQYNTSEFINEIMRESEKVLFDNGINCSNVYKKEYLERLIQVSELIFVKDGDFGFNAVPFIFYYIELLKLEIKTSCDNNKIVSYLKNLNEPLNYIINFKPHKIKSPFMSKLECNSIGGYSVAINDLKNNIIKELNNELFNNYQKLAEYQEIIDKVMNMK